MILKIRLAAMAAAGLALSGCMTSLPVPDYTVKTPAPYRVTEQGTRVDNEGYTLDAEGYRLNKQGDRIGAVDVQAKTAGDESNAVAGYYISSTGSNAPGKVATASEGATAGPAYGPGSANPMQSGAGMPNAPATPPAIVTPSAPPATGAPVPLAPSTK